MTETSINKNLKSIARLTDGMKEIKRARMVFYVGSHEQTGEVRVVAVQSAKIVGFVRYERMADALAEVENGAWRKRLG